MFTEQLITLVEGKIKDKYPDGLKGLVSEVYILTVEGALIMKPYMDHNPIVAQVNALQLKLLLAILNETKQVSGVVQVTSGWIVDGLVEEDFETNPLRCSKKKEVLMFNAKGETGAKVRVYEVHKIKGKRLPSKLAGTFDSMTKGGG